MGFRKENKHRKKDLSKRTEKSQKNKDSKGTFLKYYKLPEGIEEWRPKEGEHIFDVIPFNAGKQHPEEKQGELVYKVELWVHQNIGNKREPIVCPYENFGKDCPICAFIKSNFLEKEIWQKIAAKRRVLYLVWVHSDRDLEKKGLMAWETSHFQSEKKFLESAKNPRGGGSIVFSDYEEGQSLYFEIVGKGKNQEWKAHKCIPREGDSAIPDKIMDKTFALDECIDMHPKFENIVAAFEPQKLSILKEDKDSGSSDSSDEEYSGTGEDVPYDENYSDESSEKSKKKDKKKKKDKDKKKKKKDKE